MAAPSLLGLNRDLAGVLSFTKPNRSQAAGHRNRLVDGLCQSARKPHNIWLGRFHVRFSPVLPPGPIAQSDDFGQVTLRRFVRRYRIIEEVQNVSLGRDVGVGDHLLGR